MTQRLLYESQRDGELQRKGLHTRGQTVNRWWRLDTWSLARSPVWLCWSAADKWPGEPPSPQAHGQCPDVDVPFNMAHTGSSSHFHCHCYWEHEIGFSSKEPGVDNIWGKIGKECLIFLVYSFFFFLVTAVQVYHHDYSQNWVFESSMIE